MELLLVEIVIPNPKVISVNEQYIHPVRKTKNGRYTSYFAKSPYLKEVQQFYKDQLDSLITDEQVKSIQEYVNKKDHKVLKLEIEIGMPEKDIFEVDISNYIKSIEDCIVKRTGVDDVFDFTVNASKSIYERENGSWILRITIKGITMSNFIISYK